MSKLLRRMFGALALVTSLAWGQATGGKLASEKIPGERLNRYSDLAVEWEQQYLRIDTTNPPGNEARGAAFFKKVFDAEGIENRVFAYAPGRADLWARIPHTAAQPKRPLI